MKRRIYQAGLIIIFAVILALMANSFSANKIPYIGHWPSISGSDSILVPPSAQKGDPPFISLDEAAAQHQSKKVIFIDARDPADFEAGRIIGAVNIPFEMLDEYWPRISEKLPIESGIVTYCSGEECESSLFLGRYLVSQGYSKIYIFFGGWSEWEKAKLPTESGASQ